MRSRWLLPFLCGVVALLAGFATAPAPSDIDHLAQSTATTPRDRGDADADGSDAHGKSFALSAETPVSRMAAALGHMSRLRREAALDALAEELTPSQLAQCLESARKLPVAQFQEVLAAMLANWAAREPVAAAAWARGLPRSHAGILAEGLVVQAWAQSDPAAARQWALGTSNSALHLRTLSEAVLSSPEFARDPASAIRAALARPEQAGADEATAMIKRWAEHDPREALQFSANIDDPALRERALSLAFEQWAQKDASAAATWLRQSGDERLRAQLGPSAVQRLAGTDARGAYDFAQSLPAGRDRDRALAVAGGALAAKDPALAAVLADALPFDAKNDGLIALYASWGYSGEGMADAVEHLVRRFDSEITLPAEKQRAEWMLAACAENWAMSTSPEQPQMRFETVGNLVAAIPDGPANTARVAAIGKLLERWLGHDPAGARTWALALPESPARGEALTRIIGPLAAQSSSEVVALLAMLPAGTSRDAAVEGFAGTAFRLDPGGALAWLRTIPNPEQQRSSLQQGWQKWAERDPEAAARWRDSAPDLSQAERAALQMW